MINHCENIKPFISVVIQIDDIPPFITLEQTQTRGLVRKNPMHFFQTWQLKIHLWCFDYH
jgi:hypothetical protein